jgi:hypothetical protein
MQQFRTNAAVRLEVLADATAGQNKLRSPRFALGQWPWQTTANSLGAYSGFTLSGTYSPGMGIGRIDASNIGPAFSEYMPATPGLYYFARYLGVLPSASSGALYGWVGLAFYDKSFNLLGGNVEGSASLATATNTSPQLVKISSGAAPSGTAWVRMSMRSSNNSAGTGYAVGNSIAVTQPMVLESSTVFSSSANPTYDDGAGRWVNVLGASTSITVNRAVMDAGTLSATLIDPTLDPATGNALLTKGRTIRLTANDGGTWQPLYTGTIDDVTVAYTHDDVVTAKVRTTVTLTAVDGLAALSGIQATSTPAAMQDLTRVLAGDAGTGWLGANDVDPPMPWKIDGTNYSTQSSLTPMTVAATRSDAVLLDQVLIVRDTNRARAWVDANGALNLYTTDGLISRIQFTDVRTTAPRLALYTDIKVGYDQGSVVNGVTLVNISNDATGAETNTQFGPFVDAGSVTKNGSKAATITTAKAGADATWAQTYANAILASNAQPKRKVSQASLAVVDASGISIAGFLDLTMKVDMFVGTLINDPTGGHRISGIQHTLTANGSYAEKWVSTYTFTDAAAQAQPLEVLQGGIDIGSQVVADIAGASVGLGGGWATSPTSATGNTSFTVARTGRYLVTMQATGYRSAIGLSNLYLAIDNVGIGGTGMYHNSANVHMTWPMYAAVVTLSAGTHVWKPYSNGDVVSDFNDRATFTWTPAT